MPRSRALCFLAATLLWTLGVTGILTLGSFLKVNIALMLIAFGSAFLVLGLVFGLRSRGAASAAQPED